MNNKDAIIKKITDDAAAVAESNIKEARDTAAQVIARAQKEIDKFEELNAGKAEALYQDALARSEVVANLDCKKMMLNAKKEVVDRILDEAIDAFAADKKTYLALIEKMISSCCEDGDEVVICERDEKIVTKKFVAEVAKKTGKKLTRGDAFGDFKGGVMLSGKNYDKNLTLDLEFESLRDGLESKIVEILFGGE